ncbi:MAG TPA: gluconokinase, GntK/IdnK-type [Burkholderiaceae bacterium]
MMPGTSPPRRLSSSLIGAESYCALKRERRAGMKQLVIMGVSGSGKSSVAIELARRLALPMVEGDEFHGAENKRKMAAGTPLNDADRVGWLAALAQALATRPDGVVLSCSALKLSYRDQLRAASSGLGFVFLDLPIKVAAARVASRRAHFFNSSLVRSQFEVLERPEREPDVLRVDGMQSVDQVCEEVLRWPSLAAWPSSNQRRLSPLGR